MNRSTQFRIGGFLRCAAMLGLCACLVPSSGCSDSTDPVAPDSGVVPKPDKKITTDTGVTPDEGGSTTNKLKHGILGRHSAITAHGDTLMASAYEASYGDLVLITAKTSGLTTLTKEIVDGIPAGATATFDPKGWRGGISDKGDDVGLGTDIAVDGAGKPMISYHDKTSTNRSLKFASKASGKWVVHHVQKAKGKKEQVGAYTSLLMVGGKPAIAYAVLAADGSKTGSFKAELRWAQASKAAPTATGDWSFSVIDSTAIPCQNLCDKTTQVCVVATDGSSACASKSTSCSKCGTNQGCVGGKCVTILPHTGLEGVPSATGLWASAVNTSAGPLVLYHDSVKGTLKAAKLTGGKWTVATVASVAKNKVGKFCSAAVDKAGAVHVVHQNSVKKTMHYIQLSSSTMKATVSETVDDGMRTDGLHLVGGDAAVALDSTGKVKVAYQDQTNSDLLYATRAAANNWTPKTTTDVNLGRLLKGGAKGYGFYNDLVVSAGKVYGSNFYFEPKASPEGNFEFFAMK